MFLIGLFYIKHIIFSNKDAHYEEIVNKSKNYKDKASELMKRYKNTHDNSNSSDMFDMLKIFESFCRNIF